MYDVFISYNRENRDKAHLLAEALVAHGLKVWWDVELLPGDKFADEINAIIKRSSATIVLWSERSVKSDYVRAEASLALNKTHLIPLRLDQCVLPLPFGEVHTLDISSWKGNYDSKILVDILRSIEKIIGYVKPEVNDDNEIVLQLTKPELEAEYWKEISKHTNQNIKEYKLYVSKFGEGALFYDLAKIRIATIKHSKSVGETKTIALIPVILIIILLASLVFLNVYPEIYSKIKENGPDILKASVFPGYKESGAEISTNENDIRVINIEKEQLGYFSNSSPTSVLSDACSGNIDDHIDCPL